MWKYILAWFPMVPIAIVNGAVRQGWYQNYLGELAAHQVSKLTAMILFGAYIGLVVRGWPPESGTRAALVGVLWLAMTVTFEFLFGHYIAEHSWTRLLQDYNLFAGRVWPVLLAWVTAAPYLFYRLANRGRGRSNVA